MKKNEKFRGNISCRIKKNSSHLSSHSNEKKEKNNKKFISRASSALFLPQINTINIDKYIPLSDKEKQKLMIKDNLKYFLAKIKRKNLKN